MKIFINKIYYEYKEQVKKNFNHAKFEQKSKAIISELSKD